LSLALCCITFTHLIDFASTSLSSTSFILSSALSVARYICFDDTFSVSSSTYQSSSVRSIFHLGSSFDLDSPNSTFEECSCHVSKWHPLDPLMFVDVVDDAEDVSNETQSVEEKDAPFMHLDDLRLPTDLRMDRHGENEAIIFLICKVKLLEPQPFYLVGTDESILR
jgi:hypothetical protein